MYLFEALRTVTMRVQIRKLLNALLLRAQGILLVMYFGVQICYCGFIGNTFNKIDNRYLTTIYAQTQSLSVIACCSDCNIYNWCRSLAYKTSTGQCQLSDSSSKNIDSKSESDSEWVTFVKDFTACKTFLVSGPEGINNSQLTASSYYQTFINGKSKGDGRFPWYARLNSTGLVTGAWAPRDMSPDEYVQADFIQVKSITAIALQGRSLDQGNLGYPPSVQYITRFKVLTSSDCHTFDYITDDSDDVKIFQGNSSPEEIVTRYLPEIVLARCIRINPVQWFDRPSLRFDVLGC